mmetsp:Transcript_122127/g.237462  ORF Transcript_122127/g.237462 Transcript_122127/m.237462 type:complete len:84 (+) Transcript_122127:1153-1404(+)
MHTGEITWQSSRCWRTSWITIAATFNGLERHHMSHKWQRAFPDSPSIALLVDLLAFWMQALRGWWFADVSSTAADAVKLMTCG